MSVFLQNKTRQATSLKISKTYLIPSSLSWWSWAPSLANFDGKILLFPDDPFDGGFVPASTFSVEFMNAMKELQIVVKTRRQRRSRASRVLTPSRSRKIHSRSLVYFDDWHFVNEYLLVIVCGQRPKYLVITWGVGVLLRTLRLFTSGVHFCLKSGCRPKTSPGLVFNIFVEEI